MAPKSDAQVDPVFEGASSTTDILIVVMGQTGAGKSYFINTLFGKQAVKTSSNLNSCTQYLEAVPVDPGHEIYGHFPSWPKGKRLVLVDTPGFDDTHQSDVEILKRVGKWLANSYSQNMTLAGVIYLHNINHSRITNSASKNFDILQKLCGKNGLSSVVLGTTQWDIIKDADILHIAKQRQDQLRKEFWNGMLHAGSTMRQVKVDEPWSMINAVYPRPDDEEVLLRIQDELVNLDMKIAQTDAGIYLRDFLLKYLNEFSTAGLSPSETKLIRYQLKQLKLSVIQRLRIVFGF